MGREDNWIGKRAIAQLIRAQSSLISRGDFSDFVEVTAEEKAAWELSLDENCSTISAVAAAELLGVVAHKDGTPVELDVHMRGALDFIESLIGEPS
jgi:hypothetical protein